LQCRKSASDRSRNRLLEDSGVRSVDRFDAVDTAEPEEVEAFVRRCLDKLGYVSLLVRETLGSVVVPRL
jgi:hypothetical protein